MLADVGGVAGEQGHQRSRGCLTTHLMVGLKRAQRDWWPIGPAALEQHATER